MSPAAHDGYESDDSDFYGDEYTASRLKQRVNAFNPELWTSEYLSTPTWPQRRNHAIDSPSRLHNPYAGIPYAWQLTETVDEFLARLPPATTYVTEEMPWIYICNPYIPRLSKQEGQNRFSAGNEDEAPEEEGSQLEHILHGGMDRLSIVKSFEESAKSVKKPAATVTREVNKERKQASEDILMLAHAGKVRTGKWMIFCPPAEVNEVWEVIAKATANNELGIAAKVAPKSPLEDPRKDRLICIYTSDFYDKPDIGRVLQKLRDLRLVEARSKQIYYKPDIFTHLGIASGNPWGLKASIYSSSDVFTA